MRFWFDPIDGEFIVGESSLPEMPRAMERLLGSNNNLVCKFLARWEVREGLPGPFSIFFYCMFQQVGLMAELNFRWSLLSACVGRYNGRDRLTIGNELVI